MMGGQPIIILKEGTEREKGKGAVYNSIAAARAVADAVKSTLGPKGMDKMLVDSLGDVTITNDGVTILKEIEIEHPTAKMLVEVAKTQDDEVGDGTTSAVVLAGELLKAAESLIEQEVHPTIIVNGYRMAAAEAVRRLRQLAFDVKRTDKATLGSIARTAMSGRSVGTNADLAQKGIDDVAQHYLAKEGIYAVRRVKESDMKKLAKATGARSVTNLDDLTAKELGRADLVEERKVGTDDMTFVTGCKKARAVSILIRGGTEHVVDEVERILHDALRVVAAAIEDGKAIAGGGSAEIELSIALKDYAATVGGREQLAIRAFGGAFARRACASGRSPFGKTSMISVHSPGSASAACRETSIRKRAATPSALTIRAGVFVRPRTRLTCAFSPSVSRALSTACSASSMDRRE